MVPEAKIAKTDNGLVPEGEGWYVLNAREASWLHTDELGVACTFEGDVRFAEFGINVSELDPGAAGLHVPRRRGAGGLSRPRR